MARSAVLFLSTLLSLTNAAPQLPFPGPLGLMNLVGTQERTASRPGAVKTAFVYGPFTLKGKDVDTSFLLLVKRLLIVNIGMENTWINGS
jgi:hypothetical protein